MRKIVLSTLVAAVAIGTAVAPASAGFKHHGGHGNGHGFKHFGFKHNFHNKHHAFNYGYACSFKKVKYFDYNYGYWTWKTVKYC